MEMDVRFGAWKDRRLYRSGSLTEQARELETFKLDLVEDPGVDGRIILRLIFSKLGGGGMDWINLAQDRDRWRALLNAVMNLRFP